MDIYQFFGLFILLNTAAWTYQIFRYRNMRDFASKNLKDYDKLLSEFAAYKQDVIEKERELILKIQGEMK